VEDPERLAGAFICGDFKSPLPEGVPEDFPWFSPIAEALMKIDDVYETKREGLVRVTRSISGWSECPPVSSPRRALRTLFRLCAEVGLNRGFKRCVTECTCITRKRPPHGPVSRSVERMAYRDFRFQGRAVFAGIEPPAHRRDFVRTGV